MTRSKQSAIEQLLAEGMAEIAEGETLAKAAQDQLDEDFKGLNATQKPAPDADDDDDQDDEDLDGPDSEHEDDEDQDDDDDDDGSPKMSKAAGVIDAMPLLASIDDKFGEVKDLLAGVGFLVQKVNSLEAQVTTLAKSVQAQANGTLMIAKAVAPNLDAPVRPPSKRAVVPTAYTPTEMSKEQVIAKCEQAVELGKLDLDTSMLVMGMVNANGVDGAKAQLPRTFEILEGMK